MKRVVITGMGVISSIGIRLDDVARSLDVGESGIGIDSERRERGFRSSLAGVLKGFDAAARFDRKARRTMGEAAAYGCAAALDAIADASLELGSVARPEVGAIFGNDSTCEAAEALLSELQAARVQTNRCTALCDAPGFIPLRWST